jgi:tetrahydrodipicolinate N-succinyltransferase
MQEQIELIERGFEQSGRMASADEQEHLAAAVQQAIAALDTGEARVAEPVNGEWQVNQWLKKAVLLSFRLADNDVIESGHSRFYDKVPMKYADYSADDFRRDAVRVAVQAGPTIIEDDCFIGARSEVVEGVVVERGSVLSMGVYIGQSTRIFDRDTGEISFGRVPAGSVVVPGSLPSDDGSYSLYCAVIVKHVDEKTRAKTSLNDLLRNAK